MSILKSIFSKPFIEGLGTGLATSAQRGVQDAMDDYDDRIQRIARTRVSKAEEESKRWTKEFTENDEEIKSLVAQLNQNGSNRGIEVLHSLISKNGYGYAKTVVPEITSKLVRTGMVVEDLFNLPEIKDDGSYVIPTNKQLANKITIPMDVGVRDLDLNTALEGSGMNILNIFSRGRNNALAQAKKYVETELALSGYSADKLQTDFGELPMPAIPDIKLDRFELLLNQSYTKDLDLINAKLEKMNKDDKGYNELKQRAEKLEIIIANTNDKPIVPGSANEKRVTNILQDSLGQALRLNARILEGQWQEIGTKTNNGRVANTYGITLAGLLALSKEPKNRGTNNAPMLGYIDRNIKSLIADPNTASIIPYDEPIDAMQFLSYAAGNLLRVKVITREMIKNDSSLDRNKDGSPYFVIDGQIDYDRQQFAADSKKNNKSGLPNKDVVSKDDNQIPNIMDNKTLSDTLNDMVINFKENNNSATVAGQIANFILRHTNATLTEQQLKDKFKEITGVDWQANFGNILDD